MPRKITTSHVGSDRGVIESPHILAAQAGVDIDTYALARCIASEHGSGNETEKAGIAWSVVNEARHCGVSVYTLLATRGGGRGFTDTFGSQNQLGGRFASTRLDPTATDIDIARRVLTGQIPDITAGSRRFFDPASQDRAYASGLPGYNYNAAGIMAKWGQEGWVPVYAPGVDHDRLVFFTKGDVPVVPATYASVVGGDTYWWLVLGFGVTYLWLTRRRT